MEDSGTIWLLADLVLEADLLGERYSSSLGLRCKRVCIRWSLVHWQLRDMVARGRAQASFVSLGHGGPSRLYSP